jgi:SAM-dependent methyltransferase
MTQADRAFSGSIPELYEHGLGPVLFEPYARELAARFSGFEGDILEIAAGTGQATRALAQAAPRARITATDLNGPMLAEAARVVRAPNVSWSQADAQALPFADSAFEAVVCQFGAMFFPDKPAAFREARRVLKAGGRLVFSVWDEIAANDFSRVLQEALSALYPADPPGFMTRGPFGWCDEAAVRHALAQGGFARVTVERVTRATRAASAAAFAEAQCLGSPLRFELEARDANGPAAAIAAAARALRQAFGDGPIEGRAQALVVSAD